MSFAHDVLESPDLLEAEADVAALLPEPGPLVAAAFRLAAKAVRAKRLADENDALRAKYSAEAQAIADKW